MALNPNFAVHTDGRKLIIDGKSALMHKSSVNCPFGNKGVKFPYKLFVFGEKVRTRAVTARQTTCIRSVFIILDYLLKYTVFDQYRTIKLLCT